MNPISHLGVTTFRGRHTRFGIKLADRLSHIYLIGKTGVGKSSLLKTLALQDLRAGRGFAVVDPHGDLVDAIARETPDSSNLIYLNAPDPNQPYGYNPLRRVRADKIPLAVSGLLETLKKLWPDAWGVRMEHVLRNSLYALLEQDDAHLPDILRLYTDEDFRRHVTAKVSNETVRAFWQNEFANYPPRLKAEAVAPIQNKLGALLSDPVLYRILVNPKIELSFRKLMDEQKGLLVNVGKGRLGEDSALVLGGLIVSTIALAAFSRAETNHRPPFFLYIDEFQNFTTQMLANIMSELRKYGLGLTLAHQYLGQLDPDIRHAVIGNAGTMIAFRVGAEDAPMLAHEFSPVFTASDLMRLANYHTYLKLFIDGAPSEPFSAMLEPPDNLKAGR